MEKKLIDWLRERFATKGPGDFAKIGIGDDCAIIGKPERDLVLTCDAICDGVHFLSSELQPEQIGRKALAVNLSDLASMGAEAKTILVSLTLPRSSTFEYAQRLFLGMEPLVDQFGIEVCGGDTTIWDGGLLISVTAIGLAPLSGAWMMSGAKPGHQIVVTGSFGGSIRNQHWAFDPCLNFAQQWRDCDNPIHACTDASDSLGIDLANLATASNVGFELDTRLIPISDDAVQLADTSGKSPLDHALTDGEDFQLIMAVEPNRVEELIQQTGSGTQLTSIGKFTKQPAFFTLADGQKEPFAPEGYEHMLKSDSE